MKVVFVVAVGGADVVFVIALVLGDIVLLLLLLLLGLWLLQSLSSGKVVDNRDADFYASRANVII